jgi:hypothetical protein
MAKEIALKLKITSEGQEKVISNIGSLEQELTTLQTKLKTLDFGSEAFKEATKNISILRTKIDEVDKASEGIGAEKKFRAFGDAINIVTGSFQVLSGALALVISNEDDLKAVQQAETQALGVLNVALGINAINTALVESATLRASIATKLNAAATRAAAIATAAWNAVLALNPVVAIAAGVAALTAGIYLLIKATSDETKAQDAETKSLEDQAKVEASLIETKRKAGIQLKQQLVILTDEISTRALEIQTLEDLKKTYPGLNAFIDRNNQLTATGIQFIKLQIKAEEARAAINQINEKRVAAEIERETALQDLRANGPSLLNKALAATNGFLTAEQIQLAKIYTKYGEQTAGLSQVQKQYTLSLDATLTELTPLIKKTEVQAKADADAAKSTTTKTEAVDKYLIRINNQIAALTSLQAEQEKLNASQGKYTSEILNKQKEVLDAQQAFIKERAEKFKTEGQKLAEEISNFLFKTIPNEEEAKTLVDNYQSLFDVIKDAVKSGDIDFKKSTGWEDFVKFAETKLPEIAKNLVNVNEESKQSFVDYFNNLDDRLSAILKLTDNQGDGLLNLFPKGSVEQLKLILDVENEIGKLRAKNLSQVDLERESIKLLNERLGIDELIRKNGLEQFNIQMKLRTAKVGSDEEKKLNAELDALVKVKDQYDKYSESILKGFINTTDFVKGLNEINAASQKNVEQINKNKEAIDAAFDPSQFEGLKEYFKQNADDYLSIFTEIFNNEQQYFEKLGKEGIDALLGGVAEGLKDIDGKSRAELEDLQKYLTLFGDEFASAFGLEENPFIKALNEISKKLKELPTESEESFSKTLGNIKEVADKVLAAFSDISSRLSSIFQAQNSLLLEQLAYAEEATLATIGDATEREREEQAKVQKEYAKKRFEVEKQARIQELEFSLFNSIAQSAGAVINALATIPPPFGAIYAGVLVGLTAAQIAVINDQINFTKSKQFIGRRGGLIEGASHDTISGGVPAMLEGGEFVMNKEAVRNFGDTISSINTATGGRPMTIDDSRIVQAIAKQNLSTKTPIKAYVLYNDIQDTTKLNNKIEKLARL